MILTNMAASNASDFDYELPIGFQIFVKISSIGGIIFSLPTLYVVVRRSPPEMHAMRWLIFTYLVRSKRLKTTFQSLLLCCSTLLSFYWYT